MISIMVLAPSPKDATSFYRCVGPLAALKREVEGLSLVFTSDINWASLATCDIVFMQRPFKSSHVEIMKMAKANRKPVWVDYDDDLLNVPPSNPASSIYNKEETMRNVVNLVAMADFVTVSTQELKRRFSTFPGRDGKLLTLNKRVEVIPNAFNEQLLGEPAWPARNRLVTWRGSETHDKDLFTFTKQLSAVAENCPNWNWNFTGSPFWLTIEHMPHNRTTVVEPIDPIEYFEFVKRICPSIMVVPLHDCPFNRAKSNIAWIEGSYAGAVTLAPDWEEWKRPGVWNYTDPTDFKDKLHTLMSLWEQEPNKVQADVLRSWEFIKEELTLRKVNRLRLAVIQQLQQLAQVSEGLEL